MNNLYKSLNNQYLYNYLEAFRQTLAPMRIGILNSQHILKYFESGGNNYFINLGQAYLELAERFTRIYQKPNMDIFKCTLEDKDYKVEQEIILSKSFCNLIYYKKINITFKQPKLLIIAPLAGHYASLLRDTVQSLLPYFELYFTDWANARDVPLEAGKFDLDDYIDYLIEFFDLLSPDLHVLAVCQPTVPALAAAAIISDKVNQSALPATLILMGGPVDARQNPTQVDDFATHNTIERLEQTMITQVPGNYPGAMRKVYPGFAQLLGFISLNIDRHLGSHLELFKNIALGEEDKANKQRIFYDEYFAGMDITAEFYLQTIKQVFQEFTLAKGEMISRGRKVDLTKIKNLSLLGIEGERDDIAAPGQTKAALDLCSSILPENKHYYMQKGVGHYGVFSGSKFREFIVPIIQDFIYKKFK